MGIFSKIFKKDKDGASSATSTSQAPAASQTSANLDKPQGVILHTNLGDITIALYSEQTPRVSSTTASIVQILTDFVDLQELCDFSCNPQVRQCHLPQDYSWFYDPGCKLSQIFDRLQVDYVT
jgi:hypothetical protein